MGTSVWPINTLSTGAAGACYDATGQWAFMPDSCSCVMTYDESGNIATETLTDPVNGLSFRRTYTFTGANLTAITGWVKQ